MVLIVQSNKFNHRPTNHDRQIVAELVMPMIGQSGHLINDKAGLWWCCLASPMSRTRNINGQGKLAATRVYNLCVYRSYTNRNTTQGTMVCPAALSSLSLLVHNFEITLGTRTNTEIRLSTTASKFVLLTASK